MPKNRLLLDADPSSRVLDIIDAGPFIGYSPERLDREGGSGAIERVGGTPRVLPDAPLRLDAISRFDANVKYKVRRVRAESFPDRKSTRLNSSHQCATPIPSSALNKKTQEECTSHMLQKEHT